ncbi:MAG: transcriptional regulator TrmB [Candidatus Taylorbacteria bacterium]|nr:transcriptional regulator TrmB [Candidatus Taylorbacteria bacterium]
MDYTIVVMNITKNLEEMGFSKKEARVYLSLFKLKDATAFKIAADTSLPKTSVYHTLKALEKSGYISSWKKNTITYFFPESPNLLLKKYNERKTILEELIPELKTYSEQNEVLPYAKLYTGKEGVKIAMNGVLENAIEQKTNTIYSFIRPDFTDIFPKISDSWIQEREKHGISIRIIRPVLNKGDNTLGYEKNGLRETKVMPGSYPIESSIYISGSKSTLFAIKDHQMYAATIDSVVFANMFKNMFLYIWDTLPKE